MKDTEESRFVMNLLRFVFEAHELDFPRIYSEVYPNINYSLDTRLTPAMREGIIDNIENLTVVSRRADCEAIGEYYLRQLMDEYSEENLLDFISFKARACLFANLDEAALVDEFELIMNVFQDALICEKFTPDSWDELEKAGKRATVNAKERLAANARRLAFGKKFPKESTSSGSSLDATDEPEWKKSKPAMTSTSSSDGVMETGAPSAEFEKLELSDSDDDKTLKVEESVFLDVQVSKSESKVVISEGTDKVSDAGTETELGINQESGHIAKSVIAEQINSELPEERKSSAEIYVKSDETNVEGTKVTKESCEVKAEHEAVSEVFIEIKHKSTQTIDTETKSKEVEESHSMKCSVKDNLASKQSEPINTSDESESLIKDTVKMSEAKIELTKGESDVCNVESGKEPAIETEKDTQPTDVEVSEVLEN